MRTVRTWIEDVQRLDAAALDRRAQSRQVRQPVVAGADVVAERLRAVDVRRVGRRDLELRVRAAAASRCATTTR